MHALITTDTIGGVWTYTQELVSGLARHGHQITLVSFGKLPAPQQTEWLRTLPAVDFRPTEYRLEWMEVADIDIQESRSYLKFLVDEIQPDILHFSQYCYGDLDVNVPRLVVAHSDVVSWWAAVHGQEPDPTPWMQRYRQHVTNGLRGADLVVAPSKWMLNALSHHYREPENAAVIHNGRSPELFDCDQAKENVVLSVGRIWDAGKQISLLLQSEPRVPIRIAGWVQEPGREKKELPPCPHKVELLREKSQHELRDLYASAAVYAATSRYEPFGLSPLEAAFSSCALVLNDIPTFHELWGDAALYFRKDNPADLRRAIDEVSRNQELRDCYGRKALERAREKFTASQMVEQYERTYDQVITGSLARAV